MHEGSGDHAHNFELTFDRFVAVVNDFVGRKDELEEMSLCLQNEASPKARIVVLHGMGGIGKTQLASTYLNQIGSNYSARFFVSGSSRSSFIDDFLRIAEDASLPQVSGKDVHARIKDIWRWLNLPHNNRWLIVLDSVDDPGNGPTAFDINDFVRNAKQGSLIVTTRLRSLALHAKHLLLEVKPFDDESSMAILENNAGRPLSHGKSFLFLLGL